MTYDNWDKKNRIVTSGLIITYSKQKNHATYSWKTSPQATVINTVEWVWSFTRLAQKSYRYVGMSKSVAERCQQAMISKYTRNIRFSDFNTNSGDFTEVNGGSILTANIYISPMESNQKSEGLWACVVEVSDETTFFRNQANQQHIYTREEMDDLFAIENSWDYEEEDEQEGN